MEKKMLIQSLAKIQDRKPTILGSDSFQQFAIFLPLIERNGEKFVLFEVRSEKLRRQPGEICFPGGKMDLEDFNQKQTAIRETCEELGVQANDLTVIAPLDYIVTPFGTIIYPFVGQIHDETKIIPNEEEVGEIFTVPLKFFTDNEPEVYYADFNVQPEKEFPLHLIPGGENYKWRVRSMEENFYLYENRVIWGLTAKILKHFVYLIKNQE